MHEHRIFWAVILTLTAVAFALAGVLTWQYAVPRVTVAVPATEMVTTPVRLARMAVGEHRFALEVADTPASRQRGLQGRTSLCPNCGMMFVFDAPGIYDFWMKDTPLPLDILWVRDGRVVGIVSATEPLSERTISAPAEADTVIELSAGTAAARGIATGDSVVAVPGRQQR